MSLLKIQRGISLVIPLMLLLVSCKTRPAEPLQFAEINTPSKSRSPMITLWSRLDSPELQRKVDSLFLYNRVYPLTEPDPLYPGYLHITFIYRDTSENKEISFDIFGNYDDRNLGDRKMTQLRQTGLWYRSYYMPADICFSYRFTIRDTVTHTSLTVTDPLNPERIPRGELKEFSWSVLDLRSHEKVWNSKIHNNLTSKLIQSEIASTILRNTRKIWVYQPEGYDPAKPGGYPVIYLFDSFIYLNRVEVPTVLDNLVRAGLVEPMVAVFIDNPSKESRETELPLNFAFKDFVVKELVPGIRAGWNITKDPGKTVIGGMSYGGLAAGFIGFYHDSLFGRVLSQSGSFWRDTICEPLSAQWSRTDWLISRYQLSPKKNLRLWLDWGLQEPLILNSNRKFVRVLDGLGYACRFKEFDGWHDWSNSRKTFPEGLIYLMN